MITLSEKQIEKVICIYGINGILTLKRYIQNFLKFINYKF